MIIIRSNIKLFILSILFALTIITLHTQTTLAKSTSTNKYKKSSDYKTTQKTAIHNDKNKKSTHDKSRALSNNSADSNYSTHSKPTSKGVSINQKDTPVETNNEPGTDQKPSLLFGLSNGILSKFSSLTKSTVEFMSDFSTRDIIQRGNDAFQKASKKASHFVDAFSKAYDETINDDGSSSLLAEIDDNSPINQSRKDVDNKYSNEEKDYIHSRPTQNQQQQHHRQQQQQQQPTQDNDHDDVEEETEIDPIIHKQDITPISTINMNILPRNLHTLVNTWQSYVFATVFVLWVSTVIFLKVTKPKEKSTRGDIHHQNSQYNHPKSFSQRSQHNTQNTMNAQNLSMEQQKINLLDQPFPPSHPISQSTPHKSSSLSSSTTTPNIMTGTPIVQPRPTTSSTLGTPSIGPNNTSLPPPLPLGMGSSIHTNKSTPSTNTSNDCTTLHSYPISHQHGNTHYPHHPSQQPYQSFHAQPMSYHPHQYQYAQNQHYPAPYQPAQVYPIVNHHNQLIPQQPPPSPSQSTAKQITDSIFSKTTFLLLILVIIFIYGLEFGRFREKQLHKQALQSANTQQSAPSYCKDGLLDPSQLNIFRSSISYFSPLYYTDYCTNIEVDKYYGTEISTIESIIDFNGELASKISSNLGGAILSVFHRATWFQTILILAVIGMLSSIIVMCLPMLCCANANSTGCFSRECPCLTCFCVSQNDSCCSSCCFQIQKILCFICVRRMCIMCCSLTQDEIDETFMTTKQLLEFKKQSKQNSNETNQQEDQITSLTNLPTLPYYYGQHQYYPHPHQYAHPYYPNAMVPMVMQQYSNHQQPLQQQQQQQPFGPDQYQAYHDNNRAHLNTNNLHQTPGHGFYQHAQYSKMHDTPLKYDHSHHYHHRHNQSGNFDPNNITGFDPRNMPQFTPSFSSQQTPIMFPQNQPSQTDIEPFSIDGVDDDCNKNNNNNTNSNKTNSSRKNIEQVNDNEVNQANLSTRDTKQINDEIHQNKIQTTSSSKPSRGVSADNAISTTATTNTTNTTADVTNQNVTKDTTTSVNNIPDQGSKGNSNEVCQSTDLDCTTTCLVMTDTRDVITVDKPDPEQQGFIDERITGEGSSLPILNGDQTQQDPEYLVE